MYLMFYVNTRFYYSLPVTLSLALPTLLLLLSFTEVNCRPIILHLNKWWHSVKPIRQGLHLNEKFTMLPFNLNIISKSTFFSFVKNWTEKKFMNSNKRFHASSLSGMLLKSYSECDRNKHVAVSEFRDFW